MTNAARWNLQMGVPENKMYEHTNYTSDGSALDNWILAQMRVREIAKQHYEQKEAEKLEKNLEEELAKMLEKELGKLTIKL